MNQKLELKKNGFGKNSFPKVVDTQFTQLIQTDTEEDVDGFITPERFFEIYDERFYELPIEGEFSHKELIRRSSEYVGIDSTSEEVELLLDEINDLRMQLLQSQQSLLDITNPTTTE